MQDSENVIYRVYRKGSQGRKSLKIWIEVSTEAQFSQGYGYCERNFKDECGNIYETLSVPWKKGAIKT